MRSRYRNYFLLIPILAVLSSMDLAAQLLIPIQDEAGIDHVYTQRVFNGGGIAFFDSDNDGDDDLYMTGGEGVDHFYLNNGDGTFKYHSPFAGINITLDYYTTGVNIGDVNNDGFNDIFVTTIFDRNFEMVRNLLFLNLGNNTFREIWDFNTTSDKVWSMGSVFLDFDLDGDLDIYTINYIENSNLIKNDQNEVIGFAHTCYANRFYENKGNLIFEEISAELGLNDTGCALAVTATDYDNDGDIDLFVANDFGEFITPNKLYRNEWRTEGRFVEEGAEKGADQGMYGMGIAVGDIDNDLDQDLYVTNLGRNVLLRNDLQVFTDITDQAGCANTWNKEDSTYAVSWGTNFLDIDNDQDLDLFVVNGFAPSSILLPTEFEDADQLYYNDGHGTFTLDTSHYPASNLFTSRGTAYSDYDNDGDLDICTIVFDRPSNMGNPKSILYRNSGNENNWLELRLVGVAANKNAYGSRVIIYTDDNQIMREVSGGASHLSHNSNILHFGLGSNGNVDSLKVFWTGGANIQTLYDIDINQLLTIEEDTTGLITTSINEIKQLNGIIYPNPVRNILHFQWDSSFQKPIHSISIMNSLGQLAGNWEGPDLINENGLNISHLKNGLYIILIRTKEETFLSKFVKVK